MSRVRTAVVLLALAQVPALAQDWRDDDSIWQFRSTGIPHRVSSSPSAAPTIVPKDWIALTSASGRPPAEIVLRWILRPDREAPTAGEQGWTPISSARLPAVACAYATVVVAEDEVRMARLTGAHWLVVNDSAHIGDPERRGDRGVPIALKKGANRLFVVDASEGWELELWKPATRCVVGTWDVGWPHVTSQSDQICYPIFNASAEPAIDLRLAYGHGFVPELDHRLANAQGVVPGSWCRTSITHWSSGGVIAPLALIVREHYYIGVADQCGPSPGRSGNRSPVALWAEGDEEAAREVLFDSDASYERKRLVATHRAFARKRLARTAQWLIPEEPVDGFGNSKRVLLVYGTGGTDDETRALLARSRLDQQVLWYACGEAPLVLTDVQFLQRRAFDGQEMNAWLSQTIPTAPVVLYGNAGNNAAWASMQPKTSALAFAPGAVHRGDEEIVGSDMAATLDWASPDDLPGSATTGFASSGLAGARLSLALGMLPAQDGLVRVDSTSSSGFRSVQATRK